MKKRILITHTNMVIGGIEKALINLLKRIDPEQYEVDLLFQERSGDFFSKLPSSVNILNGEELGIEFGRTRGLIKRALRRGRIFHAIGLYCKFKRGDLSRADEFLRNAKPISYDYVISFSMQAFILMRYVTKFVTAKKKFLFIHNEPQKSKRRYVDGSVYVPEAYFEGFDFVFGVSNAITEKLKEIYPLQAEKFRTMYNFIDAEEIKQRAEEYSPPEMQMDAVKLLSVGRVEKQKNFIVIPSVAEILKKKGIKFTWCIVGGGLKGCPYRKRLCGGMSPIASS